MKIKREIFVFGIVLLCILFTFSFAFGKEFKPAKQFIKFSTGGKGGSWYVIAAKFAQAIEQHYPTIKTSVVPGGGKVNPTLVERGDFNFATCYNWLQPIAFRGAEDYKKPCKNIRHVTNIGAAYFHPVLLKESPIESIYDLKGKSITPGKKGWGTEYLTMKILNLFNVSYDTIRKTGGTVNFIGHQDAFQMMMNRNMDIIFNTSSIPHPATLNIATLRKIKILKFTNDQLEKISSYIPGVVAKNMPKNPYPGVEGGFPCPTTFFTILCNANLSNDLVYHLTKLFYEELPGWKKTMPLLEDVYLKEAILGNKIPLHPGAERFYKEAGILK